MSSHWFRRAALAAALGLGVWAGLARAAGPKIPNGMTELPPGVAPEPPGWFQRHFGLGCWASFNGYGCSSLHSELAFIFGSCRTFYSEPCLKGPPPSPLPPWAGQVQPGQPGSGQQAPEGDCHCP
jgi:hypothetical protein